MAALVLALTIKKVEGWMGTLEITSGVDMVKAEVLAQQLLVMLQQPHKEGMKTIYDKYSSKDFYEVALNPIPTVI